MTTGRLHVTLAGSDIGEGDVAACEVLGGEDRSLRTATLFAGGAASTIDVPQGVYLVRATLPSGQTLTGTAHVSSDEDVRINLRQPESTRRPSVLDHLNLVDSPELPLPEHETHLWAQRWEIGSTPMFPRPLMAQSTRQQPGSITIELGTAPGRHCIQIGGRDTAWRVLHLPPAYLATITVSTPRAEDGFHDGVRIDAVGASPVAAAMLGYLTSGELESAQVIAPHLLEQAIAPHLLEQAIAPHLLEQAQELFQAKRASPEGAAVAGYFLLRTGQQERLGDWPANFADWFPHLPDAAVIHAWQLLRRPDVPERALARERLVHAAQIGVPAYTEGLRLLFEGLRVFAAEDPDDLEIRALRERVHEYAAACDWSAAYTTYWAARPDQPSLHRHIGDPSQSLDEWTPLTLSAPATDRVLRVLYLTPSGDADQRGDEEIRRVRAAVAAASRGATVEIEHESAASMSELIDWLTRFRPHIVHLAGHGDQTALDFVSHGDPIHSDQTVTTEGFARAVGAVNTPPSVVVLNACRTLRQLNGLLDAVPVAIGTSVQIDEADAISFAARLYSAVADGRSVEGAYAVARAEVAVGGIRDADLPMLVHTAAVDPAHVRLI